MTQTQSQVLRIIGEMLEISNAGELEEFIKAVSSGAYRYLLTFDMGCGNTSAAVCRIDDYDQKYHIQWRYNVQSRDGHIQNVPDMSIPTIFGYDDDEPVIGPEAMLYGNAVENFKVIPNDTILDRKLYDVGEFTDVPLRRIWKRYFEKTFAAALEDARMEHPEIKKENVIFVVARPADEAWKDNLDSYKKLIMAGTGLQRHQVITFSEAKASMQYVRIEKKLPINWKKGVIVIDLGASTIDVEYLVFGKPSTEFSIAMAGKDVDYLLGNAVLSSIFPNELAQIPPNELPEEAFFQKHIEEFNVSKAGFSWWMRNLKESVCRFGQDTFPYNTPSGEAKIMTIDKNYLQTILETKSFAFSCSDLYLAEYMGAKKGTQLVYGTWYEYLEKLVTYLLTNIGTNYADKIIVTGGTANLIGIESCIARAVKKASWPEIKIEVLNQPSDYERTVPYGSASYLTNVIKNTSKILTFPSLLKKALKEDLVPYSADIIRNKVAPVAKGTIKQIIKAWAALPKGHKDSSINALKKKINSVSIDKNDLRNAVDQAISEIQRNCAQKLQPKPPEKTAPDRRSSIHLTAVRVMIEGMGKRRQEPLQNTMAAIYSFLKDLSMSEKYEHPISVSGLQFNLEPKDISKVVQDSFASVGVGNLITGFWNSIKYIFIDDDKPSSPTVRQSVLDNFDSVNTIHSDLLAPIQKEFSKAFDAQSGFGIVEQIIADLETDINQAMFIG